MSFKSTKYADSGDCFVVALENIVADHGLYLCHGIVHGQGPLIGLVYPHAWNETRDGYVIDQSNGNDIYMPKSEYYSIGKIDPNDVRRYTFEQAGREVLRTEIYGPWDSALDFEYREARMAHRKVADYTEDWWFGENEYNHVYRSGRYLIVIHEWSDTCQYGVYRLDWLEMGHSKMDCLIDDGFADTVEDALEVVRQHGYMPITAQKKGSAMKTAVAPQHAYIMDWIDDLELSDFTTTPTRGEDSYELHRDGVDLYIECINYGLWSPKLGWPNFTGLGLIKSNEIFDDPHEALDELICMVYDANHKYGSVKKTSANFDYSVVTEIDPSWSAYDKSVAQGQLDTYGEIYVDLFGQPIDNEYDLWEIEDERRAKMSMRRASKKMAGEDEIELVIDGEYCDGYVYLSHDSDRGVVTCDTEVECWGDNGVDTIETYFECPDNWDAVDIAYDIAQQVEFEYGADLGIDMARFTNTIATELQYIVKESKRKARIVMTAKQRAERLARKAAKRTKRAFIEWQPVSGGYGLYEYDDGEYLFMMQEPESAWGETAYILDVFDSNNPNKQIVDTEEFDSKEDLENFIIERRFGSKQAAMTRDDILDAIAMFAQSQGSYGRMLEALEEMREYDPDRYEAIMSAWEAEGFNDIVDFVMYIEGSRKARRNTKRASKKTAYAEVPVNSASSSDFDYLYSQSALTWEGMSSDKGNLDAIFEAFQEAGAEPKNSLRFYEITGQAMNEHYGLTGSNAYPDDLTILSIPLEDFDKGSALVMWRMQVGARWFDDVVDNNERREMGW